MQSVKDSDVIEVESAELPQEKLIILHFSEKDEFLGAEGDFGKYWPWHVLHVAKQVRSNL